eukprot:6236518-Pyramimonas_sp.AAC.1
MRRLARPGPGKRSIATQRLAATFARCGISRGDLTSRATLKRRFGLVHPPFMWNEPDTDCCAAPGYICS